MAEVAPPRPARRSVRCLSNGCFNSVSLRTSIPEQLLYLGGRSGAGAFVVVVFNSKDGFYKGKKKSTSAALVWEAWQLEGFSETIHELQLPSPKPKATTSGHPEWSVITKALPHPAP